MNKLCKLCDGHLDFRKFVIEESFGKMDIAFSGSLKQCNADNAFRFCPLCGKPLTKENFGNGELV